MADKSLIRNDFCQSLWLTGLELARLIRPYQTGFLVKWILELNFSKYHLRWAIFKHWLRGEWLNRFSWLSKLDCFRYYPLFEPLPHDGPRWPDIFQPESEILSNVVQMPSQRLPKGLNTLVKFALNPDTLESSLTNCCVPTANPSRERWQSAGDCGQHSMHWTQIYHGILLRN